MGTIIDGNRVVFLYGCPPDSMVEDRCSVYAEFRMLSEKGEGAARLTTETKTSLAATVLRQRGTRLADEIQLRGLQSHPAGEEDGDDA